MSLSGRSYPQGPHQDFDAETHGATIPPLGLFRYPPFAGGGGLSAYDSDSVSEGRSGSKVLIALSRGLSFAVTFSPR